MNGVVVSCCGTVNTSTCATKLVQARLPETLGFLVETFRNQYQKAGSGLVESSHVRGRCEVNPTEVYYRLSDYQSACVLRHTNDHTSQVT